MNHSSWLFSDVSNAWSISLEDRSCANGKWGVFQEIITNLYKNTEQRKEFFIFPFSYMLISFVGKEEQC